ncbi:MAG: glycosyltransferase family 4 protein [Desulforhopalus sp.]|nr:glycosyltransferase family 4 protein [Desulforhopalus sp.]
MKILILSTRLPYPQDTGAKIRAFQLMRALAEKHEVTLATFYGAEGEEQYFKCITDLGVKLVPILLPRIDNSVGLRDFILGVLFGLPVTVAKYRDRRMRRAIDSLVPEHDVIYCEHMHMAQCVSSGQRKPKVLDAHNVEAQIAERLMNVESHRLKKLLLFWNFRQMLRYEGRITRKFDLILAVSEQDRAFYTDKYRAKNAVVLENGVDLEYFHMAPAEHLEKLRLVFVGMMGWKPNSDGILYFVTEIFPQIQNEFPSICLDIVGKNPPADVIRLKERPGVRVTGTVDDVRPYVWDAQVYVVPLRFGGGTRLKILEAFAMRKAVVSTTLGCEGIICRHGKELLVADEASDFAEKVICLLRNESLRRELGENAVQLAGSLYGWRRIGEKMLGYFSKLLS